MINIIDQALAEFFLIHRKYLVEQLDKLPMIKAGKHRDQPILRSYYDDHHHYKEISRSSSLWDSYQKILSQREKLTAMLKQTENMICTLKARNTTEACSIINTDNGLDSNLFDNLKDSSCSLEKTTAYLYNGRNYRSRSEMMIAVLLDELGLEFKYDVKMILNGEMITADFVIVLREFNRCILIEYFGRSDDPKCNHRNSLKVESYQNAGIYVGRDLFILSGNDKYTPGADVIRIQLLSMIAEVTCFHLEHH